MAEVGEILFGTFTLRDVAALYSTESSDLQFGWQRKKSCHLNNSSRGLLKTPQKIAPPSYSPGAPSPNIPQNPPTTPVSDFESRGPSPNPLQSRLNANAPPFVPNSLSDQSGSLSPSTGEGESTHLSGVGRNLRPALSDSAGGEAGAEKAAPQGGPDEGSTVGGGEGGEKELGGSERTSSSASSSNTVGAELQADGGSVPIQTVGLPTPSLPTTTGVPSTESDVVCRQVQPAAPPSVCSSMSDAARSPNSTPLHSPLGTHHQLPLSHLSPSHTHSSTSTILTMSPEQPEHREREDSAVTPTRKAQTPQGTHHSSTVTTVTNITPQKPKTWASIVSKSGSGSVQLTTPTTPTAVKEGREEGGREGPGEGLREVGGKGGRDGPGEVLREVGGKGGRDGEDETKSSGNLTQSKPSAHMESLGEQLQRISVSHDPVSLQPRGLINHGNWCYMHAPLQALISVPEICHLLHSLNPNPPLSLTPSDTPLTDTMTQFIRQFERYQPPQPSPVPSPAKPGVKKKRSVPDVTCGAPFRPDCVYDLLHKIHTSLSTKGRQEDAEEFLCCVLGGLHEEMVAAQRAVGQGAGGAGERRDEEEKGEEDDGKMEGRGGEGLGEVGEDGEWEQVGPKNKSTITRQTSFNESPVSEVFGGELRSVLQRHGAKESATVEPFFSLQLDIQSEVVWTVQEAMEVLATRETVQMNSGTRNEVEAHRRLSLARLPAVLVLHMKRFLFNKAGGSQKVVKHVQYSLDLEVGKDLLAPAIKNKLTAAQRAYRLWAVVYHHGKSAVGGHYTCDVRHTASGSWLRFDDSIVKPVLEEAILRQPQITNKVAYLLFYRRCDYARTK